MICARCKREIFKNEATVTIPAGWSAIVDDHYHLSCWQTMRDERDEYSRE